MKAVIFLVLFMVAGCGTAPAVSGYKVKCKSNSKTCSGKGDEKRACRKNAPAGYFWRAGKTTQIDDPRFAYYCHYSLQPMAFDKNEKKNSTRSKKKKPGCLNDNDCKGDRICENGECAYPRSGESTTKCKNDNDCPEEEICENGRCSPPAR